ncbi:MAG TPA: FTR1 family protein, partial [Burkholderiales bacterium]|nr:FTR1 family protein [Burkholderiales bacterium]
MFATAIILFREVLEASLVIAIILGASRSVPGRIRWVSGGIALGVAGAALVAIFADRINSAFSGSGQALFNAIILLAAVTMLGWHNVWMSTHGKKMTTDIKNLGEKIQRGSEPPVALLVISFVAVMREGSEAVLFLWAIAAGGAHHIPMISGGLLGIAAGALSGFF